MAQVAGSLAGAGARLIFIAAGERHSLPAADISEVVRGATWTRVPNGPPSLLGVANLRGAVLPVVSLAVLLGHTGAAVPGTSRLLVVDRGAGRDARFGLLVDEVAALTGAAEASPLDLGPLLARAFATTARRVAAAQRPAPAAETAAPTTEAAGQRVALIGLRLARQDYAIRLSEVVEVLVLPPDRAHVPHSDRAMLGVIARPGGLLPLVSLRALLGLPADTPGASGRIIVTSLGAAAVGLVADAVNEILRVPPGAFDPVPPVLTRGRAEARIEAICRLDGGQRLVCLLAVAALLDAETNARILALTEGDAARMSDAAAAATEVTEQFVVFRLGNEEYGLPIAAVDEVVRRPASLTRIPHAPGFVAGVMNLRGRVIPVIEQRTRFSVAATPAGTGQAGRVLVVTMDGLQAGFAVDAVTEVLRIAATNLRPTPGLTGGGGGSGLFDRVAMQRDGRMILLADPKALLDQAERDLLSALAEPAPPSPIP